MSDIVYNDRYTNGIIGPKTKMLESLVDGGTVIYETTPGCWGPMITPNIRGGHEVTVPVAVRGAEVGDSLLVKLKSIRVKSKASSSGVDEPLEERFVGDPFVMKKCPGCGKEWPEALLDGIGLESIKCSKCRASVSPFSMIHGYTMLFDVNRTIGLTLNRKITEIIAKEASLWAATPRNSKQFSVLIANKSDLQGIGTKLIPFMGQLGTTPRVDIPDSHNAGDLGHFLVDAPHPYSIEKEQLRFLTDGHMDIDTVREGSILLCPVKIEGGGLYAGDMHAQQGDGEIAGHTTDVSGELTVEVNIIKNLNLEGPLLLPRAEDLPPLARYLSEDEHRLTEDLARRLDIELEHNAPIQIVGTGENLNRAVDNGLERASSLFKMKLEEIKNRVTITGGIEIGRLPGVVQVTLKVPIKKLDKLGIYEYIEEHYS